MVKSTKKDNDKSIDEFLESISLEDILRTFEIIGGNNEKDKKRNI